MPRNPDKPFEERYLSRIVIHPKPKKAGTYGWQFRFHREDINITRFFSDTKFGGKEQALITAQQFRDDIEKLYPPPLNSKEKFTRRSSKNKSGIVGVSRADYTYTKKDRTGTYLTSAWVAQWTDNSGKRKTNSFSIPKHGEREALRLAIIARRKAIDELTGTSSTKIEWGENSLNKLVTLVESSKNSNEKGKALEELLVRLFENSQSFLVNGINTTTETEEIDVMVLNNSNDARFKRESAILLVECKNWSNKCGKNEFVIFKEKVENRKSRCSLGFLISWNGFADTVTKEMLRGSREQALVIPLDGDDIKRAIRKNDIEAVLAEAWDKAITL
jgi:hypothetical protein